MDFRKYGVGSEVERERRWCTICLFVMFLSVAVHRALNTFHFIFDRKMKRREGQSGDGTMNYMEAVFWSLALCRMLSWCLMLPWPLLCCATAISSLWVLEFGRIRGCGSLSVLVSEFWWWTLSHRELNIDFVLDFPPFLDAKHIWYFVCIPMSILFRISPYFYLTTSRVFDVTHFGYPFVIGITLSLLISLVVLTFFAVRRRQKTQWSLPLSLSMALRFCFVFRLLARGLILSPFEVWFCVCFGALWSFHQPSTYRYPLQIVSPL